MDEAKLLIERMMSDRGFAERAMKLDGVDARMKFFRESGFECSVEGIRDLHAEVEKQQLHALSSSASPTAGRCTADNYSC